MCWPQGKLCCSCYWNISIFHTQPHSFPFSPPNHLLPWLSASCLPKTIRSPPSCPSHSFPFPGCVFIATHNGEYVASQEQEVLVLFQILSSPIVLHLQTHKGLRNKTGQREKLEDVFQRVKGDIIHKSCWLLWLYQSMRNITSQAQERPLFHAQTTSRDVTTWGIYTLLRTSLCPSLIRFKAWPRNLEVLLQISTLWWPTICK